MSRPRQIIPGATYLVTRRCSQRQFLLAPTAVVEQVFLYCLAVAAQRTGVQVHAVTVMSNHYHLVATDPHGRIPEFAAWLHEFVARALNAHYGRWENFWASEPTSYVRLVAPEDVLDKTVYTLTNPVAAGLVARGEEWPGVRLFAPGDRVVERPQRFFRAAGSTPRVATLTVVAPPLDLTAQASMEKVRDAVLRREAELRAEAQRSNRRFLGVARVRAQHHTDTPATREPRRELSPAVACRNQWLRIETLARCKGFLQRYRDALRTWLHVSKAALFPPGTYMMTRRYSVSLAPA